MPEQDTQGSIDAETAAGIVRLTKLLTRNLAARYRRTGSLVPPSEWKARVSAVGPQTFTEEELRRRPRYRPNRTP